MVGSIIAGGFRLINGLQVPFLSKFLSRSKSAGKYNGNNNNNNRGTDTDSVNDSFESKFLALPLELKAMIFVELELNDILALRCTCRNFRNVVSSCSSEIVRDHTKHRLDPLQLALYPPPRDRGDLRYLIDLQHRTVTSHKLSSLLCNFVAGEILRHDTAKRRRRFQSTWRRMQKRLVPLIFTLNHFFEEYRSAILERSMSRHGKGKSFQIYNGPTLWDDQNLIMDKYHPSLLLDCYHVYGFLLQAFEYRLRAPQATPLQMLRGWNVKPATTRDIEVLLILGGMDQVYKVLRPSTYPKRCKALSSFINGLDPDKDNSWRQNWDQLGVGSLPGISLDKIPNLKLGMPALHLIWVPSALKLLLSKEVIEHVDFGVDTTMRSTQDFVSDMVGYDIMRSSSPYWEDDDMDGYDEGEEVYDAHIDDVDHYEANGNEYHTNADTSDPPTVNNGCPLHGSDDLRSNVVVEAVP